MSVTGRTTDRRNVIAALDAVSVVAAVPGRVGSVAVLSRSVALDTRSTLNGHPGKAESALSVFLLFGTSPGDKITATGPESRFRTTNAQDESPYDERAPAQEMAPIAPAWLIHASPLYISFHQCGVIPSVDSK